MTVLESIIKEVQKLPAAKQAEVAGDVHRLSEAVQQQGWARLGRVYGSLPDPDGMAFEEASIGARRLPRNGYQGARSAA